MFFLEPALARGACFHGPQDLGFVFYKSLTNVLEFCWLMDCGWISHWSCNEREKSCMLGHSKFFVTLPLVVLAGLSFSQGAEAFEPLGPKWREAQVPVPFRVNNKQAPQGFQEAVLRAAETWGKDQSQIRFQFRFDGSTDRDVANYQDGVQSVYFNASGQGQDSTTLATTFHWSRGAELIHFDMVFNGRHDWSDNPNRWQYDLESVCLHEFGHALGLDHSQDWRAVMYPSTRPGTTRRALHQDDLSGASQLYPGTGNAVPAPGAPALVSPIGNAQQVRPTFRWNAATNAVKYSIKVQRLEGDTPKTILNIGELVSTEYTPNSSLQAGTYYWQVMAYNSAGHSQSSNLQAFFISGAQKPARAIISSPGQHIDSQRPAFSWTQVPGASSYEIWVNQVGNGQSRGRTQLIHTNLTQNRYTPNFDLPRGYVYHWWVRAFNGQTPGDWTPAGFYVRPN